MVVISNDADFAVPNDGFHKLFINTFTNWASRVALVDGVTDKEYRYSELSSLIQRVAGHLYHVAGVRKGEVMCMCLPNCLESTLLLVAGPSIGAVITGCNPAYTTEEISLQLRDSNAIYFITTEHNQQIIPCILQQNPQIKKVYIVGDAVENVYSSFREILAKENVAAPAVHLDGREDLCLLPYSSGTTGLPKGVMLTHYNLAAAILALGPKGGRTYREGQETTVCVYPLFHLGGIILYYLGLMSGATMVLYPKFDFETFLAANAKYKATHMGLQPPVLVSLAKHPSVDKYDLSSVEVILTFSAPSSKETHLEVKQRIPSVREIRQLYAMTENTATCTSHRPGGVKLGSVGTVLPNSQYKIVDPQTGDEMGAGQPGEVCTRGPVTMKGYLNNPDKTAQTIKDGWIYTGDIGHYDEEGHLYITDRLKELIKYKGFQVAPAEVEAVLLTHPAVADVAVVGLPDLQAGELPRAYIVLKHGHQADEEEIKEFVKGHVAYYKHLRGGVEFTNEIPKNPSGKILRRVIKSKLISRLTARL